MSAIATATPMATTTTAFGPLDTTTCLRPAQLLCPECAMLKKPRSALAARGPGKSEFWHCAACGGVWFQDKGVDEALKAACNQDWPVPSGTPSEPSGLAEEPGWSCPCCRGTLVGVNDRRRTGIIVRRCLVCYGGWIQYADLRRNAACIDLLSRVGRTVRSFFFE